VQSALSFLLPLPPLLFLLLPLLFLLLLLSFWHMILAKFVFKRRRQIKETMRGALKQNEILRFYLGELTPGASATTAANGGLKAPPTVAPPPRAFCFATVGIGTSKSNSASRETSGFLMFLARCLFFFAGGGAGAGAGANCTTAAARRGGVGGIPACKARRF
jgi:hypothetical protein